MKRIKIPLSLIGILFLLAFTGACKKCGHCEYPPTSSYYSSYSGTSVCKRMNAGSKIIYDSAESTCKNDGGNWVID